MRKLSKLVIVRHGKSSGNKNKIIQGKEKDYFLVDEGIKEIIFRVSECYTQLKDIEYVYTSSSLRTIQTAEVILDSLGKQLTINSLDILQEVDPGILSGMSHFDAEEFFSEMYRVWKKRGDLDEILGAEGGEYLQARVIAFLERYLSQSNSERTELIVTHAGFERCLINTIMGRSRTDVVNVGNVNFHFIDNVWGNITHKCLKENEKNRIYYVETVDKKYVLKKQVKIYDEFEKSILNIQNTVKTIVKIIPEIYWYGDVNCGDEMYSLKVLEYMKGEHCFKQMEQKEIEKIFYLVNFLFKQFNICGKSIEYSENHSLRGKICYYMQRLEGHKLKKLGKKILSDSVLAELLTDSQKKLVLYDLHRENIVFYDNCIRFIDMDAIMFAPKDYQLASFIVAFWLINDPNIEVSNFEEFLCKMECLGYNANNVKMLLLVRIFTGLAHFEITKPRNEHESMIVATYWKAFDLISKLINDSSINIQDYCD